MNYRLLIKGFFFIIFLLGIVACHEQDTPNTSNTGNTDNAVKDFANNTDKSHDLIESNNQERIRINEGFDLTPDEIRALTSKANSGDGDAAQRLYIYYSLSVGDSDKEMHWMRKAAENGHPTAQYNLGITIRDHPEYGSREEGVYWLRKAADAGDLEARIELGIKFSENEIDKLSRQSDAGKAQSALTLYSYYKKVEKDDKRAKYWFKRWQELMHNQ